MRDALMTLAAGAASMWFFANVSFLLTAMLAGAVREAQA